MTKALSELIWRLDLDNFFSRWLVNLVQVRIKDNFAI